MKEMRSTGFGDTMFDHGRMTERTSVSSDSHWSEFP